MDEALFLRLQTLARLRLPTEEAETLRGQLEQIVAFVRQMETLEEATPDRPPNLTPPPLREDAPAPAPDPEAALAAAPDTAGGLFRVPPVFGPESA